MGIFSIYLGSQNGRNLLNLFQTLREGLRKNQLP